MNKKYRILICILLLSILITSLVSFAGCGKKSKNNNLSPEPVNMSASSIDNTYLADCDKNIEFIIKSDIVLAEANFYKNILVVDKAGDYVALAYYKVNNLYYIKNLDEKGYTPGETYNIYINNDIYFHGYLDNGETTTGYSVNVNAIEFSIFREESYTHSLQPGIKYINKSDVQSLSSGENKIVLKNNSQTFATNDIVVIGTESDIASNAYKIVSVDTDGVTLNVEQPNLEEVYKELDIYTSRELDYSLIDIGSIDTMAIAESAKSTPTYMAFNSTIAQLLNSTSGKTEQISPPKSVFDKLNIKTDVTIKAANANGINVNIKFSWNGNLDKWGKASIVLEFDIKYEIKIKAHLQILPLDYDCGYTTKTTINAKLDVKLSADGAEFLQKQVEASLKKAYENEMSWEDSVGAYLDKPHITGNTFRYPIVRPVSVLIPYTPITFNLEIGLFASLDLRVDLNAEAEYVMSNTAGIRKGSGGAELYKSSSSSWELKQLILQGNLGITAGVYAEAFFSVVLFENSVRLGVRADVGAYFDFTGEMIISANNQGKFDKQATYYAEAGIYLKIGGIYRFFNNSGEFANYENKLKLWSTGTERIELGFDNKQEYTSEDDNKVYNHEVYSESRSMRVSISDYMAIKHGNLRTLQYEYENPDSSLLNFSWNTGGLFKFSGDYISIISTGNQVMVTDYLTISLKSNPSEKTVIKVTYFNEAALQGLYTDNGVVYKLNRNGKTYSVMSAPITLKNYTVLSEINTLPVVSINDSAFYGCSQLESINLSNVTAIGKNAFYNCTALKSVDLSKVTEISDSAFANCKELQSVEFSSGLKKIPISAFQNCKALSQASFKEGLQEIGANAFYNSGMTAVTIPSTVNTIGNSAFGSCSNLRAVKVEATIPPTLSGLPFFNSGGAEKIVYIVVSKNNVTIYQNKWNNVGISVIADTGIIGDYLVANEGNGCKILLYLGNNEEVIVPASLGGKPVMVIGRYSFSNLTKKITLPSSVTAIENFAFKECSNLKALILTSSTPPTVGIAIFESFNQPIINVPKADITKYQNARQWLFYLEWVKPI